MSEKLTRVHESDKGALRHCAKGLHATVTPSITPLGIGLVNDLLDSLGHESGVRAMTEREGDDRAGVTARAV
jgi:hypothetical protein